MEEKMEFAIPPEEWGYGQVELALREVGEQ